MPREYKKLIYNICITTTFMLIFGIHFNVNRASADAIGVVSVSGYLNVRKGPDTSYDPLKSGGTSITLTNGHKVSIAAKAGKWYNISFKLNGSSHKGYVMSSYVKVQGGRVCTSVRALVIIKDLKLMDKASTYSSFVKAGEEDVTLSADEEVMLISEFTRGKQKWYYVSCNYKNKTYKGYIRAENLKISYDRGIPAILNVNTKMPLYKNVARGTVVEDAGKKVNIGISKQFTVIREEIFSKNRYFYVKVRVGSKTVYGYLAAAFVKFQIVREQKVSVAEASKPSAAPTQTSKPDITPSPSPVPTNTPTPSPAPLPTNTPTPTKTPAPLSDSEFKKKLKDEGFSDSYIKPLMELHTKYPRWEFKAFNTGLNWATVIKNESVVGVNLLSINKSYDWKSTEKGAYDWNTDKYIPHDGSTWVAASEKAVKYYMDPRNFLDERGVFQFESLEYNSESQTQDGVEKILNNTPMYDKMFTYTNQLGTKLDIKYSETFMKAAESSGVSPYHLASRVKQEVVISPTLMSTSVSGTVSGYKGIYNFYNIGAYDSTISGGAIANGLKWASTGSTYNRPWNDRYKSLTGGAEYIGKNYINAGQNTLYLEKFNVTSKNRYDHQYMTNVEAPNSEATKTVSAYGVIDKDMPIVFSIPIYEGMPDEPCEVPSGGQNPNNYLKTLYVQDYTFESAFKLGDDGSKKYKLTVDKNVESIKICAKKVSEYATLSGTGEKELSDGLNTFTVRVTSESGNIRKYIIEVTRGE